MAERADEPALGIADTTITSELWARAMLRRRLPGRGRLRLAACSAADRRV
jgi:hypothetical protein